MRPGLVDDRLTDRSVDTAKKTRRMRDTSMATSQTTPHTSKQQKFIDEYFIDFNATQAAIRAGYSAKTADVQGARLLGKVQGELAPRLLELRAKLATTTEATVERVVTELSRIAFADPRHLFGPNGEPLSIHELSDAAAAAIAGLDVLEEYRGEGEDRVFVGYTKKYRLCEKNTALGTLAKYLGMLIDRKKIDMTVTKGTSQKIDLNRLTKDERERLRALIAKAAGQPQVINA